MFEAHPSVADPPTAEQLSPDPPLVQLRLMVDPTRRRVALAPMLTETGTTDTVTCELADWQSLQQVST